MDSGSKFLTFTSILMLALVLQVLLAVAEQRDNPEAAAVEFAKAYFQLEPSMAGRLCRELVKDPDADVVADYLERVGDEARGLGFEPGYMVQGLDGIQAKTSLQGADRAQVTLTAVRRRTINPVFGAVARWFFVGETHPVEATLDLVKEDGRWKVCGRPLALIGG